MSIQNSLINFSPFKYIENPSMIDRVQYRSPRSKKKRINKKWTKLDINCHFIPKPDVFITIDNIVIGHSATIRKIKEFEVSMEIE